MNVLGVFEHLVDFDGESHDPSKGKHHRMDHRRGALKDKMDPDGFDSEFLTELRRQSGIFSGTPATKRSRSLDDEEPEGAAGKAVFDDVESLMGILVLSLVS